MPIRTQIFIHVSTVFLLTLGLAACGGQDNPENPDLHSPAPWPQVLDPVHVGAKLLFRHPEGFIVEVGSSTDADATEPDHWESTDEFVLPQAAGSITMFAKMHDESGQQGQMFSRTYHVTESYPPPAGQDGSEAIAKDDPKIQSWATGVAQVHFGEEVDEEWQNTDMALGPAEGLSTGVLCLGRGGSVVLEFDPPIADAPGKDFAVFENGINDTFLELASVEVSSDGKNFVPFARAYLGDSPIDSYGKVDTTLVGGFAGKYRQGFGTPFDLSLLSQAPEVISGRVSLDSIRYVRIIDVVGDGSQTDSFGNPVFDPYPTKGSAGFDLDAVAVLHQGS